MSVGSDIKIDRLANNLFKQVKISIDEWGWTPRQGVRDLRNFSKSFECHKRVTDVAVIAVCSEARAKIQKAKRNKTI